VSRRAPADYFTGTVYLYMLLIVIDGEGLYQERGKPIKTIKKGQTIICSPNIEGWRVK